LHLPVRQNDNEGTAMSVAGNRSARAKPPCEWATNPISPVENHEKSVNFAEQNSEKIPKLCPIQFEIFCGLAARILIKPYLYLYKGIHSSSLTFSQSAVLVLFECFSRSGNGRAIAAVKTVSRWR
jgi:hypothetical protein